VRAQYVFFRSTFSVGRVMSDEEFPGSYVQLVHRLIWDMITVGWPGAGPDEVIWQLSRRQTLTSRAFEAVKAILAKHHRREPAQWAHPIPKQPANSRSTDALLDNAPVAAFAGAFLGCLTTLDLSAFGIVPGIASALATVLLCGQLVVARTAGLFAGAFFPALYGGTFGGMTPILWLNGSASGHSATVTGLLFILLSVACGLAFFVVAKLDARSAAPIGSGYGGRLGAIATVASFLFVESIGLAGADASPFHEIHANVSGIEPRAATLAFFAGLAGISVTMFVLRHWRVASAGVAERTLIASAIALVGLVTLHFCYPNDAPTLDAFYAGCFLGMSTPERLQGWLAAVFSALVLVVVLDLVHAFLPGIGGGLGFAAFMTTALLVAPSHVSAWMVRQILTPTRRLANRNQTGLRDRNSPRPAFLAPPRRDHALIPATGWSPGSLWHERTVIDSLFEPRGSSRLATLALGAAVANAPIAAFLLADWLPHWTAAAPEQFAEEIQGPVGARAPITDQAVPRPQLVIGRALPGSVDQLIPLRISLINAAANDIVVLSGLPSGSSITIGRSAATNAWRVLARELADAAMRPPQGFVGSVDVTVDLRRADKIIGRGAQHLEWAGPVPVATAEVAPAARHPSGQPPADEIAEDHEALFREFLEHINHAPPDVQRRLRSSEPGNTGRFPRAARSGGANVTLTSAERREPARPPAQRKRRE
jgi:hypothetical protein